MRIGGKNKNGNEGCILRCRFIIAQRQYRRNNRKAHSQSLCAVFHFFNGIDMDRNAVFQPLLHSDNFLFAMGINSIAALRQRSLTQLLQIGGKMRPDGLGIAKQIGIDGDKAMADQRSIILISFIAGKPLGENGAENFAEHTVAISFMAAGGFIGAAQRQDPAALMRRNAIENLRRAGAYLTLGIQSPAIGHFFFGLFI